MLMVKDIQQFYGGSHILRGVSLQVERGQVAVLLGRNGVGKTTLLKCLMGLIPAREGQIEFNGQEQQQRAPFERAAAGMGYVPQGREIFARLTVEENLRMGMASRSAKEPIPEALFELFPVLHQMRQRRGGDLSGGQQQQLAIARALASRPDLLILDEPTEGIQPNIIKDIGRVIVRLAQTGLWGKPMGVLLCEQYFDFARELADTYWVMERGEIMAHGRGEDMERDGVRQMVSI
jgi:urea transport system ATP-binding protein